MSRSRQRGIATLGIILIIGGVSGGIGALIRWRRGATCGIIRGACNEQVRAAAHELVDAAGPSVPPRVTFVLAAIDQACPGLVAGCDSGLMDWVAIRDFGGQALEFGLWAATQPRTRDIDDGVDWDELAGRAGKLERKAMRELSR